MYFNYKYLSFIRKRNFGGVIKLLVCFGVINLKVFQGQNFVYIGINLSMMNYCLEYDMIFIGI